MKHVWRIFALAVIALSAAPSQEEELVVRAGEGEVSFTIFEARSEAVSYPAREDRYKEGIQIILQREAEEKAKTALLETLANAPLTSAYTVGMTLEAHDDVNRLVLQTLTRATLRGVSYPNRGVRAHMALSLTGKGGAIEALFKTVPYSRNAPSLTYRDAGAQYTGLIIDAREANAVPALFPSVYSVQGEEIYGATFVNPRDAVLNGVVTYAPSAEAAEQMQRLGERPYRIVAWARRGEIPCDIIISDEDAERIVNNQALRKAMKECRVVIVLNPQR